MDKRSRRRGEQTFSIRFGTVAPTEPGVTLDISHSGISFECNSLPRDKEIVILLEVDDDRYQIIGKVKWSRKQDVDSLWSYIVGVEIKQAPKDYNIMVQKLVYH